MTKIKNFRIVPRAREVARLLKANLQMQITPALEASIEHAINDVKRFLQPAAVYTTLTRSTATRTSTIPLPDNAVSVSLLGVTVGRGLQDETAQAEARQDLLQSALMKALEQETLQQAVQFISRLINDQAKEEECEISPATVTNDAELLKTLAALLGVQRIGIELDKASCQLPGYSRLVWLVWTPVARLNKSPRTAGRSEKVLRQAQDAESLGSARDRSAAVS